MKNKHIEKHAFCIEGEKGYVKTLGTQMKYPVAVLILQFHMSRHDLKWQLGEYKNTEYSLPQMQTRVVYTFLPIF